MRKNVAATKQMCFQLLSEAVNAVCVTQSLMMVEESSSKHLST